MLFAVFHPRVVNEKSPRWRSQWQSLGISLRDAKDYQPETSHIKHRSSISTERKLFRLFDWKCFPSISQNVGRIAAKRVRSVVIRIKRQKAKNLNYYIRPTRQSPASWLPIKFLSPLSWEDSNQLRRLFHARFELPILMPARVACIDVWGNINLNGNF